MKLKALFLTSLATSAILLTSPSATAEPHGFDDYRQGPPHADMMRQHKKGAMIKHILRELDLSDEQKENIKAIFKSQKDDKKIVEAEMEKLIPKDIEKKLDEQDEKFFEQYNMVKLIDDLKISEVIESIHNDYKELIEKKFNEEKDLQNILQRGMKNDLLKKRLVKMNQKQKQITSESTVSC